MNTRYNMFSLSLLVLIFLVFSSGSAYAEKAMKYDVVIIGAGTGGCSAAIQAAKMGASVALIEESDWLGGQMTGAAVSTMDDKCLTRHGIYLEFINKVREYYAKRLQGINICYWGSDTIAFEPWVGRKILGEMLDETGKVQVFFKTKPVSAKVSDNKVVSAVFDSSGKHITILGNAFVDATECGDFIPLTGARYRVGNSISANIDKDSVIQDITYVAVVKKYKDGLPPELKVKTQPAGYADYLFHFRSTIRKDGSVWPGSYPFDVPTHNAYRAIPDITNSVIIDGGKPETWKYITKTALNWANDYPGRDSGLPGMPVMYLEDKKFRDNANKKAMMKTLCFIYYMQNELGMRDWSVDNRQDFGGYFTTDWQDISETQEFSEILRHFPPFPYVRESRRIVGIESMTAKDIKRNARLKRAEKNISASCALGEYPIDIHGMSDTAYLDKDLGETKADVPNEWQGEGGLFQIPFGAFIPEKLDGLIAAEKNLSVSRIVNGSIRLQPVTMHTGQAAGAIAALSAMSGVKARDLRVIDVQASLLTSRVPLSLYRFEDVPDYSPSWAGVEVALLYGYMDSLSDKIFGVYDEMSWIEVYDALKRSVGTKSFPKRTLQDKVTHGEFDMWLKELYKKEPHVYEAASSGFAVDKPLTKGRLAHAVLKIMKETQQKQTKGKK